MFDALRARVEALASSSTFLVEALTKAHHIQEVMQHHDPKTGVLYHGHHVMKDGKHLGSAIVATKGKDVLRYVYHGLDDATSHTVTSLLDAQYLHGQADEEDEESLAKADLAVGRRTGITGTAFRLRDGAMTDSPTVKVPSRKVISRIGQAVAQHQSDVRGRGTHPGAAVCGTEGCGGRLEFHSFTDMRTGVPKTLEHCPSCKTTTPIQARRASPTEQVSVEREEMHRKNHAVEAAGARRTA